MNIDPIDCDYRITGAGDPVVMVHGIGSSHTTWDKIIAILKAHFTCVSYDLRGHGSSPIPKGSFGLNELVADLERVRERLGFEKIHVVGHSLGGMIGPAYARKFPGRVQSIGLLSTAAGRTEDDKAKLKGVINAMEINGIEKTLETLVDRWFTKDFVRNNPEIIHKRLVQITSMDADVFLNVFRIYAETEMSPWLHEVVAPSLIITGELDGACSPRLNRYIQQQLPVAELDVLANLKHSILLEAPDIVATKLQRFLCKHAIHS